MRAGAALARAAELWALAGGAVLIAIMAVTATNASAFALDRLSGAPVPGLPGYEDFVRLAISGAALMFFPYCQLRRGHVRVELMERALPEGLRRGLDCAWLIATAAAALFLAGWMTVGMAETRGDGASSPILGWAEWPFYAPGVVSLVLWAGVAGMQAAGGLREP